MNDIASKTALLSFISRIESLLDDRDAVSADVKKVKAEAKDCGINIKALNEVIRLRRMDKGEREELEDCIDRYKHVLGMVAFEKTPLGKFAIDCEGSTVTFVRKSKTTPGERTVSTMTVPIREKARQKEARS